MKYWLAANFLMLFIVTMVLINENKPIEEPPQDESTWRCVESDAKTHTCNVLRRVKR